MIYILHSTTFRWTCSYS